MTAAPNTTYTMKIRAAQLKNWEKEMIAHALLRIAEHMEAKYGEPYNDTRDLVRRIKHGELILCEYEYTHNDQKEEEPWK